MESRIFVHGRWLASLFGTSLALTLVAAIPIQAQTPTCTQTVTSYATFIACSGTLPDGEPYGFEVPTDWNGTLVLICQGYVAPGTPPPGSIVSWDGLSAAQTATGPWILNTFNEPWIHWLLGNGCAVATSFGGIGWSVRETLRDQIQTLDIFASVYGTPARTISFGASLGGMSAAGLIQQHPERFAGALSLAGPLAGSVGAWNQGLDVAFAIKQLLGPQSALKVIRISNPGTPASGNWGLARILLAIAQNSAQGRARIALACALGDVPGWFDPLTAEPAADDYTTQELNQYLWAREVLAGFFFGYGRAELEARAGGNPSWNTGVDYQVQFANSADSAEVVALYQAAGLSLANDLARLNAAPRIAADPLAFDFLSKYVVLDGDLGGVPVLTLHTTADGLIPVQHEAAYRSAALKEQDHQLLRQAYVHRGGHSTFTSAEIIAAFQTLFQRIDAGKWRADANPDPLNAAAEALGPSYNALLVDGSLIPTPPAFVEYEPLPFLRPYDIPDGEPLERRGPHPPGSGGDAGASGSPFAGLKLDGPGFGRAKGTPGTAPWAATSTADENSLAAARPLAAWPLPYRGGSLRVSFSLGASAGSSAQVAIYDLSGRLVRVLSAAAADGARSLEWDGRDSRGIAIGNGIYFLRATGAGRSAQLKFVVLR